MANPVASAACTVSVDSRALPCCAIASKTIVSIVYTPGGYRFKCLHGGRPGGSGRLRVDDPKKKGPGPKAQPLCVSRGRWRGGSVPPQPTPLEGDARHQLQRARDIDTVDGAEPVLVHEVPGRVVGQVRDRVVGQAREVRGRVDARELRVVERVERVDPKLELHFLVDGELLRQRQVHVVLRRTVQEEARRLVALAARLRRRKARGVDLFIWIAARAASRVAG